MAIRSIKKGMVCIYFKMLRCQADVSRESREKGVMGEDDAKFYAADFRPPPPVHPTTSGNYDAQLFFPGDLSIVRTRFILVHSHWASGVYDPMSHLYNQQWLQPTAPRACSLPQELTTC